MERIEKTYALQKLVDPRIRAKLDLVDILDLAKKYEVLDQHIENELRIARSFPYRPEIVQQHETNAINRILQKIAEKERLGIKPDPFINNYPTQEQIGMPDENCIPIGLSCRNSALLYIPIDAVPRHLSLLAPTGGGKTNFVKQLLISLSGKVTVIAFDRKRELRDLATRIKKGIIRIWNWSELKIALLQHPRGQSRAIYRNEVVTIFARNAPIFASRRFFIDQLTMLDEKSSVRENIYEQEYPTLFDLIEFIKSQKFYGHIADYRDVILYLLTSLAQQTGDVFDCSYSEFLDEISRPYTINIIETAGLPLEDLRLLISLIFNWVKAKRLAEYE